MTTELNPLYPVPQEVLDAERVIIRWIQTQENIGPLWEIGELCSRRFAFRLRAATNVLADIINDNQELIDNP